MNDFVMTYSIERDLLMNGEVALRATYTPPYNTNNQIVGRISATRSHIFALPLGTLCAR